MEKKVDYYFAYVYRESRSGEVTYIHSAPRLGINPPVQDYWIAKAKGEEPLHLGGVLWATTEKGK
jgi:hypothetical protein